LQCRVVLAILLSLFSAKGTVWKHMSESVNNNKHDFCMACKASPCQALWASVNRCHALSEYIIILCSISSHVLLVITIVCN